MKYITKTLSKKGHGKIGYLLEFTETEVIALKRHFSGGKMQRGSALEISMKFLRKQFSFVKLPKDKLPKLLYNSQSRYKMK